MSVCRKCGNRHHNFQSCAVGVENARREQHERLIARHNLTPELTPTEGFRRWRPEPMENVRVYGGLQVVKSGLKQTREGWKEV